MKALRMLFSLCRRKLVTLVALMVSLSGGLVALPASATTGPDYTTLTSGIDFTSVETAVLSAAALIIGVFVTVLGAKIVMNFFRRGG